MKVRRRRRRAVSCHSIRSLSHSTRRFSSRSPPHLLRSDRREWRPEWNGGKGDEEREQRTGEGECRSFTVTHLHSTLYILAHPFITSPPVSSPYRRGSSAPFIHLLMPSGRTRPLGRDRKEWCEVERSQTMNRERQGLVQHQIINDVKRLYG